MPMTYSFLDARGNAIDWLSVNSKHEVVHDTAKTDVYPLGIYTFILKVEVVTDMNVTKANTDFAVKVTVEHPCDTARLISVPIQNMAIRSGLPIPTV
jgi:hypothetical protein